MHWVRRSALGSSLAFSATGNTERAVRATVLLTFVEAPPRRLAPIPMIVPQVKYGPRRKAYPLRSGKIETIEIHDLVPRGHEVKHKVLLRIVTRVDLNNCSQL